MKIFKICFLNLIFIVFLCILFDWFIIAKQMYKVHSHTEWFCKDRVENMLPFNKGKKPIILMGCSYTFGAGVDYNQTISYKLQSLTERKVYNLGQIATGIQHSLFLLQKSSFFENNKDLNPEYIFYIFIDDHIRRMYIDFFSENDHLKYLRYEYKNDQLILKNPKVNFFDYFKVTFLYKKINNFFIKNKSEDENFEFLKKHLIEMKKNINQKYKDTKFAVIVYPDNFDKCFGEKSGNYNAKWKSLEDEGIIVLNFSEYNLEFKDEYLASDLCHPSGKAWDLLLPIIIQNFNL